MSQPPEPIPLDTLLLNYLNTLDTYQSQIRQISQGLSEGFLDLATANFHAPSGRRYGPDWYDERMKAVNGVEVVAVPAAATVEGQLEFQVRKIDDEEGKTEKEDEDTNQTKAKTKQDPSSTLRQRKKKQSEASQQQQELPDDDAKTAAQTPGDETPSPHPQTPSPPPPATRKKLRDPLRWFGILSPPALRSAQASFESTLPVLCELATTLHSLRTMSLDLHVYKLLPEKPARPLPEILPLSQLDQDSGYIHLCSAVQARGVVERFMGGAEEVWVLRIPLARVQESLKWEQVGDVEGELFPHYFGELKKEHVTGAGRWVEGAGVESVTWEDYC